MAVRRTLAGSVAALLLPALLTGCGDDESVADPPVQSSPTSSSPTGDPATHETAEHFIRRWVEAEEHAWRTPAIPAATATLSSRRCRLCLRLSHQVEHVYRAGGFVRTGRDGASIR